MRDALVQDLTKRENQLPAIEQALAADPNQMVARDRHSQLLNDLWQCCPTFLSPRTGHSNGRQQEQARLTPASRTPQQVSLERRSCRNRRGSRGLPQPGTKTGDKSSPPDQRTTPKSLQRRSGTPHRPEPGREPPGTGVSGASAKRQSAFTTKL
ncbi:hypothetical protein NDU88_001488 [Pleurodeles waltl]|uniref:Uncharacterized protein n=1 Tax=Pleurodeles waltl TaxID=8319 RepID=A0AAV7P439_PLEWA|nr:hypothetical protein NDU88_001488 [Pleurodeles waltl]